MSELEIEKVAALPTEIVFPLSRPLMYATKTGDRVEARMIVMHAPSANHSRECSALKEMFYQASVSQRDKIEGRARDAATHAATLPDEYMPDEVDDDDDEAPQLKGSTVIIGVASADCVSLGDFLDVGRKLMIDLAMVDGEAKLTGHLCNQLAQADFEKMVGEYVAGFICASDLQADSES